MNTLGLSSLLVAHVTLARRCDTVRRCNSRGRGGCRGLGGTLVDDPPHMHTGVGMTRLGWKEVNQPSRDWSPTKDVCE